MEDTVQKHQEEDESIHAYDEVYDQIKAATKQYGLQRRKGAQVDREGKKESRYMEDILAAAERRKLDRARAEERMVQREREAEGSAFADKESFVTEAFSKYREELDAMERAEEAEEARRAARAKERGAKGMDHSTSFFRSMLNDQADERAAVLSASKGVLVSSDSRGPRRYEGEEEEEKEDGREKKLEGSYPISDDVTKNDSGEVVDKRELLQAGLNVTGSSASRGGWKQDKAALRRGYTRREDGSGGRGGVKGGRNRKRESTMLQEQLLAMQEREQAKAQEEREALQAKLARKTDDQGVESAKARYLARKRAAQAKKKGGEGKEEEDTEEEEDA